MSNAVMLSTKLGRLTPADLPTPPEVALRVMRACSDPKMNSQQLARIVASDTALVAELLRIVNSPYFGMGRKVATPAQAVVVMGARALRNFVLSFSARESLRAAEALPGFDALSYWEAVLRRAAGAQLLAEALTVDPEQAFTVGILQDFGLLALFSCFPGHAQAWNQMRTLNPEERQQYELDLFGISHDRVAGLLTDSWCLPEEIAAPIKHHHRDGHSDLPASQVAAVRIAVCADWIAAVFTAADKRLALARCRKLLGDYFGFNVAAADELFAAVPGAVEHIAALLSLDVAVQASFEDVLNHANRELIETSVNSLDRAPRLERALVERERLAEELQQAYERLAQLAYYDPLTTLVNRRRFDELFGAEIARHSRSGKALSLLIMDLDLFKHINDAHGHLFGDAVLQAVSGVLKGTLRSSDVAARIGGEEMCLLLPETDAAGALIAAERVRRAIERLSFPHRSGEVTLTASFGGHTWHCAARDVSGVREVLQNTAQVMTQILAQADQALYQSKAAGRNRVTWTSAPEHASQ